MGANKRNSEARAISDRSGFRHPMREMVIEPGTGYLVHKSESDGMWNLIDHPANRIGDFLRTGDPFPVENARPDVNWAALVDIELEDENGNFITDEQGNDIEVN